MQDIHGIRPPIQVGFDPMVFKIIFLVLGGAFLLLLFFLLIKKWLKKKNLPKDLKYLPEPMAPYDAALKELDLLSQKEIVDPRIFYFDLTAVLRKYIGRSYHINAIEMTSQEFIKGINQLDFAQEIKKELSEFQKKSDPIKYAGNIPQKEGVTADLLYTKSVIEKIEKNLVKQQKAQEEAQ
ncbi:MAG: hypothetical protein GY699_25615 [Desulfobacteraceae bacterium]|nr:hypothetical protein [Desulfobacteraceae bacterium]